MLDQLAAEVTEQIVACLVKNSDLRSLALVVSVQDPCVPDCPLIKQPQSTLLHVHAIRLLYRYLNLRDNLCHQVIQLVVERPELGRHVHSISFRTSFESPSLSSTVSAAARHMPALHTLIWNRWGALPHDSMWYQLQEQYVPTVYTHPFVLKTYGPQSCPSLRTIGLSLGAHVDYTSTLEAVSYNVFYSFTVSLISGSSSTASRTFTPFDSTWWVAPCQKETFKLYLII
jgi:hypothetical protein